jgi:hypothetical protein
MNQFYTNEELGNAKPLDKTFGQNLWTKKPLDK